MMLLRVLPKYCKGCGLCIAVCPKDCIEYSPEISEIGIHPVRPREGAQCVGCLNCAVLCPDAAIEIFEDEEPGNNRARRRS